MNVEQFIYLDNLDCEAMNLRCGNSLHILISLGDMNLRKNVSLIQLSKRLNYDFLLEFLCGIVRFNHYNPPCHKNHRTCPSGLGVCPLTEKKHCPFVKLLKEIGVKEK